MKLESETSTPPLLPENNACPDEVIEDALTNSLLFLIAKFPNTLISFMYTTVYELPVGGSLSSISSDPDTVKLNKLTYFDSETINSLVGGRLVKYTQRLSFTLKDEIWFLSPLKNTPLFDSPLMSICPKIVFGRHFE